ncbi:hypothetical protein CEXT_71231 [Caerostris extrusa]|uniref:Uncharacterized protein n=1 Tax=Caerostris extrusa TaxID=172846 RepID=A0AAV4U555_CAEEX|nr:hypothetical protein CEXT_71231 [Caerostris extrusa]
MRFKVLSETTLRKVVFVSASISSRVSEEWTSTEKYKIHRSQPEPHDLTKHTGEHFFGTKAKTSRPYQKWPANNPVPLKTSTPLINHKEPSLQDLHSPPLSNFSRSSHWPALLLQRPSDVAVEISTHKSECSLSSRGDTDLNPCQTFPEVATGQHNYCSGLQTWQSRFRPTNPSAVYLPEEIPFPTFYFSVAATKRDPIRAGLIRSGHQITPRHRPCYQPCLDVAVEISTHKSECSLSSRGDTVSNFLFHSCCFHREILLGAGRESVWPVSPVEKRLIRSGQQITPYPLNIDPLIDHKRATLCRAYTLIPCQTFPEVATGQHYYCSSLQTWQSRFRPTNPSAVYLPEEIPFPPFISLLLLPREILLGAGRESVWPVSLWKSVIVSFPHARGALISDVPSSTYFSSRITGTTSLIRSGQQITPYPLNIDPLINHKRCHSLQDLHSHPMSNFSRSSHWPAQLLLQPSDVAVEISAHKSECSLSSRGDTVSLFISLLLLPREILLRAAESQCGLFLSGKV